MSSIIEGIVLGLTVTGPNKPRHSLVCIVRMEDIRVQGILTQTHKGERK